MKKFLLIAAVAFSVNAMAQESLTDITPKGYDWANQEVGTQLNVNHSSATWNTDYTFSWQLGGSEYWQDGCISANATADPTYVREGSAVVDLGGEIGKVMCINGANSNAQSALGFTTAASVNDKVQINIFTDPNNTPKSQWLKAELIINVFGNTISNDDNEGAVIANYYMMSGDNDDLGSWCGNKVKTGDFVQYDDEGDPILDDNEDYMYDPNRWAKITMYFFSRDDYAGYNNEFTTSVNIPCKLKLWIPGTLLPTSTIFIKSLKFYAVDGENRMYEDPEDHNTVLHPAKPFIEYITPADFESTNINNIVTESNDNAIYNVAGQKVSENFKGIVIKNGKKFLNK